MIAVIKTIIILLYNKFKRFIGYGIVGVINTVVDFAVYSIMLSVIGLPPWLSQIIGFSAGTVVSFVLNSGVVFKDSERSRGAQFLLFVIVNVVSLGITTGLVHLFTSFGMNAYIAKFIVLVFKVFFNYFGYKLFVFRVDSAKAEPEKESGAALEK